MEFPFIKMNGAGNDFVVLDGRATKVSLNAHQIKAIASRDNRVTQGCDQLIVLEPSSDADVFMRIYNADGSEVDACGNATRCIAGLLADELSRLPVRIRTNAGLLIGVKQDETGILVDMGMPRWDWREIPLAMPIDKAKAVVEKIAGLANPVFVSMGNPHVVFFMENEPDIATYDITALGSALEHDADIFPQRVNVSVAHVYPLAEEGRYAIHARVWERGAGATQACGTAACAMLAAAQKKGSHITRARVQFLPYGTMVTVEMDAAGHLLLGGATQTEFSGILSL